MKKTLRLYIFLYGAAGCAPTLYCRIKNCYQDTIFFPLCHILAFVTRIDMKIANNFFMMSVIHGFSVGKIG